MRNKQLLLVFAKNIVLGKVKTRLAKDVGDVMAFNVYRRLVEITEQETLQLENTDLHIYFSDVVLNALWPNSEKFVQQGADLGERMQNAFQAGFDLGYEKIIGIGTDLPDLSAATLNDGFEALETNHTVFGPSDDGGYYIIGMRKMIPQIFENKPWSTESLLEITCAELESLNYRTHLLPVLNDVDTVDDLKASWLGKEFGY